jgi:type VI secretion system secreted protein VgrG
MPSTDDFAGIAQEAVGGMQGLPLVRYTFDVEGASGQWRVRKLELREGVSELYECVLELVNDDLCADVAALEGASCVVRMERGEGSRRLCGLVFRVEWLGSMIDHLLVRVHVRPALAALCQNRDSWIFQGQSVREILQEVLSEGLGPYERKVRFNLDRTYQAREYCTQYGESDLEFVMRLMSEEGIFFFFDHSGEQEELVLVDLNEKCPEYQSASGGVVRVVGPESPQELLSVETVGRLRVGREMRSTGVVLRDFDWTRPGLDLTRPKLGPDGRGKERNVYEYSPHVIAAYDSDKKVYTREEGALRAKLRKEELATGSRFAAGESNITGLAAGCVIEVEGQDLPQLGTKFLVIRVEHEGEAAEEIQHQMERGAGQRQRYRNRFTCVAFELQYRPPVMPRPVVGGPQTATVVGPGGEEIYTDEHGRVKVQFHWDRAGERNEKSSCWLRTMQGWAGAGFGSVFLPRIGMEVVVQFLEGNMDRPLVVGCVYNGANPGPVPVPNEKTKTSIITRSSPGGGGYNELTFEDAAGNEEISIRAQKNLRGNVLNDQSYQIGNDDSAKVVHDQSVKVGNDRHVEVGKNQTIQVGSNRTLNVDGAESTVVAKNQDVSVGGNQGVSVTGNQTNKVGMAKTETVGAFSMENVGAAKSVNVGAAYSVIVVGTMNTVVGLISSEEVGLIKNVTVLKDMHVHVRGDESTTVGGKQTVTVKGQQTNTVGAGKKETVTGNSDEEITGGNRSLKVDGKMTTTVTLESEETVKKTKTVRVEEKLELICGASKITLEKGGKVKIEGTEFEFTATGPVAVKGGKIDLN